MKYELENLKNLRKIPKEAKEDILEEIYMILSQHNVSIISTIIGDYTLNRIYDSYKGYQADARIRFQALKFLIERFNIHLNRREKDGIIIFDSLNYKIERNLRSLSYDFISRGFKKRIYPAVLFSNDEHSEILQTSDSVALALNSAIFRSLGKEEMLLSKVNVEKLPYENPYLKKYWPLFEKDSYGRVKGWGVKVWI